MQLTGGCQCGAIRYRLDAAPDDSGYCHCRICQRVSGAPVLAFATVPVGDFVITAGEPRRFRATDFGERWFCGDCGAQLAMTVAHQPETIDFTVASLDTPEIAAPGFHIWCASQIPWFDTRDELPRNAAFRTDRRGLSMD